MSEHDREQELEDFLILRELDEPITEAELEAAGEQSGKALSNLRDEGVDIQWVKSEVLTNEEGDVTGTFCHYRAESEDAIREHADRAGLPATRIDRRGEPLEGE
ncbi:DUF4242 domain-containing protein [Haloterrigena salifodinae]|uniref:DUF4242 domain-containing protein n=1 Tax=Haloterrigena salifodinae TaxID=2675099 RepID=A0A8T8DZ87_9EURY|nr:DUF4242 domain-containing protein [Haloterrigena salifodinae]QRV14898.1 DUF4242 domain-containing protein [Haloterrigena salifodinae]